jgi:hypothetical protein
MQKINYTTELKSAIILLESRQIQSKQILKDQFMVTYDSFRPVNILKSTFNDIVTSPNLINNILGATTLIATGYFSKKIAVGASVGIFRRLLGPLIEVGLVNLVAKNPDAVKSVGHTVLKFLSRKSEINSNQQCQKKI